MTRRGASRASAFHVVVVGGSAGSLEALETFFAHVPADIDAAFIVVTHRDPRQPGMMPEILSRFTTMRVRAVDAGMALKVGEVYVVPADRRVALVKGRFQLRERPADRTRSAIDGVLAVVAEERTDRAVGVVLSGMDSDGTSGLAGIKRAGGHTLAQDPSSAAFGEMPRSAIDAAVADFVGPPKALAEHVVGLVSRTGGAHANGARRSAPKSIVDVVAFLRDRTGHDFASYKQTTIERRVERRMNLHRITDPARYLEVLEKDPEEVARIFDDLLIGVTRFFREPAMFGALAEALPSILRRRPARPVRAWVAGCATGEEAYSLAIVLKECWDAHHATPLVAQIYATDLDEAAIDRARHGVYPHTIAKDVSAERLARFFVRTDDGFRIKKEVRELVVFATQNLVADPPFTKLDILSCRNVLIYLKPELQRKLLPLFFHALVPNGLLVLGSAESIHGFSDAFVPIDERHKIFRRRDSARGLERRVEFPLSTRAAAPGRASASSGHANARLSVADLVRNAVVELAAPAVVVASTTGELVFASRRTGHFFEQPAGKPSMNVFAMARDGLGLELRSAIRRATSRGTKVTAKDVRVRTNGRPRLVDLSVWPLTEPEALRGLVMIAFDEHAPRAKAQRMATKRRPAFDRTAAAELRRTRAQLQAVLAEMDRSELALTSTNEELQSANEELQSANEELTTSKEEMQSMNEELLALNAEFQSQNEALAVTNDDMRNLLDSTQIPTLFLDKELRLKRFTAQAARLGNLLPGDVGRPITDLRLRVRVGELARDARNVIDTLASKELPVEADDGSRYTMRIHPYRTSDDVIDGVVVAFIDVSMLERGVRQASDKRCDEAVIGLLRGWPGVAWVEELPSGRSLVTSAASVRLLGHASDTLASANAEVWRSLRHPRDRALAVGRPFRLRCGDGTYRRFVEERIDIAFDGRGHATRVLHTLSAPGEALGGDHAGEDQTASALERPSKSR